MSVNGDVNAGTTSPCKHHLLKESPQREPRIYPMERDGSFVIVNKRPIHSKSISADFCAGTGSESSVRPVSLHAA